MKEEIKRSRGAPAKAKASDVNSIEEKVLWEKAKFDAECANNLGLYYSMLKDIAMGSGNFKDASVTNRKSALEKLIARTEDIVLEDSKSGGQGEVGDVNNKPHDKKDNIISLKAL